MIHSRRLVRAVLLAIAALLVLPAATIGAGPAGAVSYQPVSGAGSTWSFPALNQWISDVSQNGLRVNYAPTGSSDGRSQFINGTTDFAASDIPFQTAPTDGSPPERPIAGSWAYMPITAGGTVFEYNLKIGGQRVTNLRLSGQNLVKIFTGQITMWNDPALAQDNPQLALPAVKIVPVVRSDGSGSSAQISQWMISQYPNDWNAFCKKAGRAPACGLTSYYPTLPGMVAQPGDQGVSGYVSQSYANGAIGYTQYAYALYTKFPVVTMLNSAGYYTQPTASNVAVSLLKAVVDTTDTNNPALYLTENLNGVYTDPDPRSYPLSAYSYLILPTTVRGQFSTAKGKTLAAFSDYAMCQGQTEAGSLGYSPVPINLVQDAFGQIDKIPGADTSAISIGSCHNPTFSTDGTNTLADTAPYPPACAKQGATQCSTGTGGATTSTPASRNAGAAAGAGGTAGAAGAGGAGEGTAGAGANGAAGLSGRRGGDAAGADPNCDPSVSSCSEAGSAANYASSSPQNIAARKGWTSTQTLFVVILLLILALLFAPGVALLLARRRAS